VKTISNIKINTTAEKAVDAPTLIRLVKEKVSELVENYWKKNKNDKAARGA
jgi:hypothetical protein